MALQAVGLRCSSRSRVLVFDRVDTDHQGGQRDAFMRLNNKEEMLLSAALGGRGHRQQLTSNTAEV